MIDLRSDTLTRPTKEMITHIDIEKLGDDGRENSLGRGEDIAVNELEDDAAELTGKEAALFFPTGTMANHAALLSFCQRGASVALGRNMHMYLNEKIAFEREFFGMTPVFYDSTSKGKPDLSSLKEFVKENNIDLFCIENTHNYAGGVCLSEKEIWDIKKEIGEDIPIFMDGARIFNAAIHLNTSVDSLCKPVDALMFCISKGLGAPAGSLLCGPREMILKARRIRKLLGGTMRQSGIIAATGLVALRESNINLLKADHQNAKVLAEGIMSNKFINLDLESIQTNIIIFEITHPTLNALEVVNLLKSKGLLVNKILDNKLRLTTYKEIDSTKIKEAIEIINNAIK